MNAQTTVGAPLSEPAILIVDDLAANQLALEATLEPLHVRVVQASSGDEALRKLLDEEFALIFMDVQMPGLDGLETASLIRQRGRTAHVPIIFITAIHREEDYVARGYGQGAVDYLMKPVDPDVIRVKASVFVELHRQTRELQERARRLAVQEAQSTMAVAAHELRTPLNAARIQAQLATIQLGDGELRIKRQLQLISRQFDRLVRLVDRLLDASQLETGRVALVRSRFDLVALAREVTDRMRGTAGHELVLVSDPPSLTINADRDRLDQVLTNLVANSIRYSPMGGRIQVEVRQHQDTVLLVVQDEGLGIAPDKLETVFFPYAQAHAGAYGGQGLGLSIAKELVESHGGRIWAESEGRPGQGTIVFVELPRLPAGGARETRV